MAAEVDAWFQSRAGWLLVSLYLVVSIALLVLAYTCREGFFCGFYAVPVLIPTGFVYLLWLTGVVPNPAILQWQVIVPTLLTNVPVYFLLGRLIGRWLARRR